MKAFILAGGFATRLWPITESRAKPLLPLAGETLIDRIVAQIPADMQVTVSTNAAFGDAFAKWKKQSGRSNVEVRVEQTRNDDEKLGALGSTAQWIAQEKIDDDVLLLTGDNYFGFDMEKFIHAFTGNALVAAFDIGEKAKASAFGTIVLNTDGKTVAAFEEKPKDPRSSLVSTGCSIIPRNALNDLVAYAKVKPDNVGGIFEELLRLGKTVECFSFSDAWFDIGSFDAYLEATRAIVGDTCVNPDSSSLTDTPIEGSVVLGERCMIQSSRLTNVVLFDDCNVNDCVLENCIIDNGCFLQGIDLTGKMLRAGTRLVQHKK